MRLATLATLSLLLSCGAAPGQELTTQDATKAGLATGARAPLFERPDQTGRQRSLASLMGPSGLVLVFFRSADWCVFCKVQLLQLERDLPLFRQAGYGIAALSYDAPAVLADFATRKRISFPLLSDRESDVIRAYGVANPDYRKGTGLDINREVVTSSSLGYIPIYGLSYPAVFVIGADGLIRWRSVSLGSELRLTGAAILALSGSNAPEQQRKPLERGRVRIAVTAGNTHAGLGNRVVAGIELVIPSGIHVYAPGATGGYRGLSWKIDESPCWRLPDAVFPVPVTKSFPFDEGRQPVYEGTVRLTREFVVAPGIKAGDPSVYEWFRGACLDAGSNLSASGNLSFQACDARQCFTPQSVPVEWKFHFVPPDLERVPVDLRREFEP